MKKPIVFLSVLFLIACGPVKLLIPTQTDADRGATKYTGYTLDELNQGKLIYEQNCKSCHRLKKPTSFPEKKWSKIVPDMVKKTNKWAAKKPGRKSLNEKEQETILRYILVMSTAKRAPKAK